MPRQGGVVARRVEAEHAHLAARRPAVSLERLDRRGLAGAVRAEHDEHLAAIGRQVQIVDGGARATGSVAHGEPGDLDGWHGVAGYFEPQMIDIRALRDDPEAVKAALARRGVEEAEVDAVIEADATWRTKVKAAEDLRSEVKALSREVGLAKKEGDDARGRRAERAEPDRSARRSGPPRRRRTRPRSGRARVCSTCPTSPTTTRRTGRARRTTSRSVDGGPGTISSGSGRQRARASTGAALGDR